MPCGKKRKRHKMATHKRKKRLRKNRHKKKGTIVKWELEALEPFEERIISYVVKTKMTIVGGYNLPIAKIQFMGKNNTERVVKSNRSSVSLGL